MSDSTIRVSNSHSRVLSVLTPHRTVDPLPFFVSKKSKFIEFIEVFLADIDQIKMLAAKSLDGQRTLRQWLDIQTDRPKLMIFNEGDLGGDRTSQSLITPLLDQSNLIVILTSNQSGRSTGRGEL